MWAVLFSSAFARSVYEPSYPSLYHCKSVFQNLVSDQPSYRLLSDNSPSSQLNSLLTYHASPSLLDPHKTPGHQFIISFLMLMNELVYLRLLINLLSIFFSYPWHVLNESHLASVGTKGRPRRLFRFNNDLKGIKYFISWSHVAVDNCPFLTPTR